jgi:hypothetical protein
MPECESMEHEFCPQAIREHSLQFDSAIFKRRISEFVAFALEDFKPRIGWIALVPSTASAFPPDAGATELSRHM